MRQAETRGSTVAGEVQRPDPWNIRVSDAEREHVLGLLQDAMARGMITPTEFGDRSSLVVYAVNRGDLREVVADLPVSSDGYPAEAPSPASPAPAEAAEVQWRGVLTSVERKGQWQVPRVLELSYRLSSLELDFSTTDCAHPVVEIRLDVLMCSVELRFPQGASASTEGVDGMLTSMEDHRREASARGRPHFVLTGQARASSVELRGPRRKFFGLG